MELFFEYDVRVRHCSKTSYLCGLEEAKRRWYLKNLVDVSERECKSGWGREACTSTNSSKRQNCRELDEN